MGSAIQAKLRFAWWWACVVAKLGFASSLVIGILVAYGMRFSVATAGPFTLGLYGVVILADFITQTSCAWFNRVKTERLAKQGEKAGLAPLDIIIAVVGYREDSDAWKKCLYSLQKQETAPRVIVGVVDGQDGPDQSMAQDFAACFPPETTLIADLPDLLSKEYTTVYWENMPPRPKKKTLSQRLGGWKRSIGNLRTEDELRAERIAWAAIEARWKEWDAEHDFNKYQAVCLTQPHGHKRTAMFTAFTLAMLVYKAQDAVFTTDSDTILDPAALRQMSYVLGSDPDIGGVTGDVKIWNKNESWLALMCALRYWFAFNIERACQSYYRCVTCISGPIGLYRTSDMRTILGPWVLQTFLGRDCTFGDDRHLTNRLLGEGRKTAYTHLAFCESDSPAGFVRWVKQQTRWSKSFFREAFWFPSAFAKHSVWLSIETFKQTLYPFILISTIFQFLYAPTTLLRPVFWLATMFGVAAIKSLYAWFITGDIQMMLFSLYGLFYFFGLLPSKIFALITINVTAWGTSARSTAERKRRESFSARHWHVCHLLLWFWGIGGGFMVFFHHHFPNPLIWSLPVAGALVIATIVPYWDLIQYDLKFYWTAMVEKVRGPASDVSVKEGITTDISEKTATDVSTEAALAEKTMLPGEVLVAPIATAKSLAPSTPSRSNSSSSFLSTLSDRSARADVGVVDPFADNYAVAGVSKTRKSSIPFPLAAHRKSPSISRRSSMLGEGDEEIFGYFAEGGMGLPLPVTTPPSTPKRRSSRTELARQASLEISTMPSFLQRASDVTLVAMPTPARRASADAGLPVHLQDAQPELAALSRRSSAGSLNAYGDAGSRPSTAGSTSEVPLFSRKDSMDRRASSTRRKSSIAHLQSWRGKDSTATLFSGGSWRPSMTERSSTSTLVDLPAMSPVGHKIAAAHSRFHNSAFKNPFAKYDPSESEELDIQVVGKNAESHDPKSLAGMNKTPTKAAPLYRGQPHAGPLTKASAEPAAVMRPFVDFSLANNNNRVV